MRPRFEAVHVPSKEVFEAHRSAAATLSPETVSFMIAQTYFDSPRAMNEAPGHADAVRFPL
jgi:hypothetical protein